jgi:hypothetical protein
MLNFLGWLYCIMGLTFAQPPQKVDLATICKKSPMEIEAQLGKPLRIEEFVPEGQTCTCQRTWYLDNQVAISYTNGKSDWIWIKPSLPVFNENKASIKALHRFKDFTFIKCQTMQNSGCCNAL